MKTTIITLLAFGITQAGPLAKAVKRDLREDRRDRIEDRIDARHDGGVLDRVEDRIDAREDRIDARTVGVVKPKRKAKVRRVIRRNR